MKRAYIRKCIESILHRQVHCRQLTEASSLEDTAIGTGSGKHANEVGQDLTQKYQICVEHSTRNVFLLRGWSERVQEKVREHRYTRNCIAVSFHKELH